MAFAAPSPEEDDLTSLVSPIFEVQGPSAMKKDS
jgi:hypothetical protein